MYHDLIFTSRACLVHANDVLFEWGPPVPPGEPTALNKERVGHSTEAPRRRTGTVRERSSW